MQQTKYFAVSVAVPCMGPATENQAATMKVPLIIYYICAADVFCFELINGRVGYIARLVNFLFSFIFFIVVEKLDKNTRPHFSPPGSATNK